MLALTKRGVSVAGRLGSASSSSSCGSAEYTGEVIPHHPGTDLQSGCSLIGPSAPLLTPRLLSAGLPRQDSGHWWTSFFFAKQNQPGLQNGSELQK